MYTATMPIEDFWGYFRARDQSIYEVFACGADAPSEADVAAFESEIGFRLETEFRAFMMSAIGGMCYVVNEEHWPRPKPYDVAPFWTFCYGVIVPGISKDIPGQLSVRELHKTLVAAGTTDLVPCLKVVGDPSMYCMDRSGKIVFWHHDDLEHRDAVDLTFSELLMQEVNELEERRRKLQTLGKARPGNAAPESHPTSGAAASNASSSFWQRLWRRTT